jgi:hypothetical protein
MDVYVIYHVLCVDIYVISLFVLMESKNKKIAFSPSLPSVMTMALGKAGKQRPNFPTLSSARAMALGKELVDMYVMGYGCVCDGIWMCM